MNNPATPEQLVNAYKNGLETCFALANKSFEGIEKFVELNLNVAKATLEEAVSKTKELLAVKDPQELFAFQAAQFQPNAEKAVSYSRHLYDILTSIQNEITKVAEEQISESNKKLVSIIDTASKNAPAGSETTFAIVKSALATANSAYDSLNKATKQAVEIAEANVAAATNAAVKTTAASAARVRKAA